MVKSLPIISQAIIRKMKTSSSFVHVSVNNIVTDYRLDFSGDSELNFYKGAASNKTFVDLDKLLRNKVIFGLERNNIYDIEYDSVLNTISFITDDYYYLVQSQENTTPAWITSKITGEETNPNRYVKSKSELSSMYLLHRFEEMYRACMFKATVRKERNNIYNMLKEFTPLIPKDYEAFMMEYEALFDIPIGKMISIAKEQDMEKNDFYWLSYMQIAKTLGIEQIRVPMYSVFALLSASMFKENLYLYVGKDANRPPHDVLFREQYLEYIEHFPDKSDNFIITTLVHMTMHDINRLHEKRGFTTITSRVLEQIGVEI